MIRRTKYLVAPFLIVLLFCPLAHAAEPTVPEHGLVKPTFLLLHGSWSAGTGFLVRVAERKEPLLVTYLHLFGPAGGLEKQMSSDEVQQQVHGAVGLSVQDKYTIVAAPEFLKVRDAHPMDRSGTDKDIYLFCAAARGPGAEAVSRDGRRGERQDAGVRV